MRTCHSNIIVDRFNYTVYNVIIIAHKGIKAITTLPQADKTKDKIEINQRQPDDDDNSFFHFTI